jgi:hypothetical protein
VSESVENFPGDDFPGDDAIATEPPAAAPPAPTESEPVRTLAEHARPEDLTAPPAATRALARRAAPRRAPAAAGGAPERASPKRTGPTDYDVYVEETLYRLDAAALASLEAIDSEVEQVVAMVKAGEASTTGGPRAAIKAVAEQRGVELEGAGQLAVPGASRKIHRPRARIALSWD